MNKISGFHRNIQIIVQGLAHSRVEHHLFGYYDFSVGAKLVR